MIIAVACTSDFTQTTGHAGRAKCWLLVDSDNPETTERIKLSSDEVFHYFEGDTDHPLKQANAIIAQSAGEGFLNKMKNRGVDAVMTGETDPSKAVEDYLARQLAPPKPRPVGELLCKVVDLFSKHK